MRDGSSIVRTRARAGTDPEKHEVRHAARQKGHASNGVRRQRLLAVDRPMRSGCRLTFWIRQLFMSATSSSFSDGHAMP